MEARQTVHVDDWTFMEVCCRQKTMHTADEWAEQAVGGGMHYGALQQPVPDEDAV